MADQVIPNDKVRAESVHLPQFNPELGGVEFCPQALVELGDNSVDAVLYNREPTFSAARVAERQACGWCLAHQPPPQLTVIGG